jgi:hypothetical protein
MTQTLVQTLIQLNVRTDVRARTLSLYTMGNSALRPLGTLGMGAAIVAFGAQNGVALFLLIAMAVLGLIVLAVPEIRRA